jgi:hypothetical protein
MLTNLGPGSNNALLYIGEDAPSPSAMHQVSLLGNSGGLSAVQVSNDWKRVYVAGNQPYSYAGYDIANLKSGPLWQVDQANNPISPDCVDIHASNAAVGRGIPGELVYFGCMGTHNGNREAMVIATQQDNLNVWPQTVWLGTGSVMGGITVGFTTSGFLRVFAIGTRPTTTGSEVFITSFDGYDGSMVGSVVLTADNFAEQFHQSVDLVLVEVALDGIGVLTRTDLVAVTYSDSPGLKKTFLWKLDPDNLKITDWREVPAPPLAKDGMFATALAVQPLETNLTNILIPGEIFLATLVAVSNTPSPTPAQPTPTPSGAGTVAWAYIYRLNPDWVTARDIEVIKDSYISSMWSGDGDLYFAGHTTRIFGPGNLYGTPKPGFSPDYDAFLGKSEGVVDRRRWTVTFDTTANSATPLNNFGYAGYGAKKGYIVGNDWYTSYVVEYPVY